MEVISWDCFGLNDRVNFGVHDFFFIRYEKSVDIEFTFWIDQNVVFGRDQMVEVFWILFVQWLFRATLCISALFLFLLFVSFFGRRVLRGKSAILFENVVHFLESGVCRLLEHLVRSEFGDVNVGRVCLALFVLSFLDFGLIHVVLLNDEGFFRNCGHGA